MEKCLFCLKSCSTPPFPQGMGMVGATNCKSLENQLLQHFVLRKLLDIPWLWCEGSLRRHGGSGMPSLLICRKCSGTVHEAWGLHQKLVSLEVRLKQAKQELKTTMLESMRKVQRRNSRKLEWEDEIRMLIFPDEMIPPKQPKYTIIREDDIGAQGSFQNSPITVPDSDEEWMQCDPTEDPLGGNWSEDENPPLDIDTAHATKLEGNPGFSLERRRANAKRKRKAELRKRLQKENKNQFKCTSCPAKFPDAELLQNHLDIHRESKELGFQCETCSFPARTNEELEIHKFNDHNSEIKKFSRPFACGVGECDFKAETWRVVKDHADREHPDTPPEGLGPDLQLKCALCSKFFETANILMNHQKKTHPQLFGAALEPTKCEQCSMLLPSRIHLQYHLKSVHNRMNSYICDLCGKGFSQPRRLDRHMIMHEGRHDFVCHLCGCSYSYKSSLSGHYKKFHPDHEQGPTEATETTGGVPSSEEEFSCKYCSLKFPFKITMIRHMKTHKETMGVQCEICSKFYINMQGLRQHMKLNHSTSDQQTQCPHCFKVFSNPHAMHTHSVKHCKIKKMNEEGAQPQPVSSEQFKQEINSQPQPVVTAPHPPGGTPSTPIPIIPADFPIHKIEYRIM